MTLLFLSIARCPLGLEPAHPEQSGDPLPQTEIRKPSALGYATPAGRAKTGRHALTDGAATRRPETEGLPIHCCRTAMKRSLLRNNYWRIQNADYFLHKAVATHKARRLSW